MDTVIAWVSLILAVLGFPAIYSWLGRVALRFQRWRDPSQSRSEVCFSVGWIEGRDAVEIMNVSGTTKRHVAVAYHATYPANDSDVTLRTGATLEYDVPRDAAEDDWIVIGWRTRRAGAKLTAKDLLRPRALKRSETVRIWEIRDSAYAALQARKAMAQDIDVWYAEGATRYMPYPFADRPRKVFEKTYAEVVTRDS